MKQNSLANFLISDSNNLIENWISTCGINSSKELKDQTTEIFKNFIAVIESDDGSSGILDDNWEELKKILELLSASQAAKGYSAGETSAFILALKIPIFEGLEKHFAENIAELIPSIILISKKIDVMAQWTVNTFQRTREEIISRQQLELLELSTPVLKLWQGVLAVPMIGTLDSHRAQLVMETLLQRIVDTESELAILDITGVPTVDTLVAQHLIKTVSAIRLMGAECIVSGVRPQIAQTIVHLGIDLQSVITKASLADALAYAIKHLGFTINKSI